MHIVLVLVIVLSLVSLPALGAVVDRDEDWSIVSNEEQLEIVDTLVQSIRQRLKSIGDERLERKKLLLIIKDLMEDIDSEEVPAPNSAKHDVETLVAEIETGSTKAVDTENESRVSHLQLVKRQILSDIRTLTSIIPESLRILMAYQFNAARDYLGRVISLALSYFEKLVGNVFPFDLWQS